jgi:hypothetical protein
MKVFVTAPLGAMNEEHLIAFYAIPVIPDGERRGQLRYDEEAVIVTAPLPSRWVEGFYPGAR